MYLINALNKHSFYLIKKNVSTSVIYIKDVLQTNKKKDLVKLLQSFSEQKYVMAV